MASVYGLVLLPFLKQDKENSPPIGKRKRKETGKGRPKKKKTIILREKKTVVQETPVIHVQDIGVFGGEVVPDLRGLPNIESLLFRLGIDEGQKLLKVSLSVIHLLAEMDPDKKVFEQRFKDSGVKKAFVVGVVPAKETHSNLEKLLDLIGDTAVEISTEWTLDLAYCPCPPSRN